jgi:hypothetical protein
VTETHRLSLAGAQHSLPRGEGNCVKAEAMDVCAFTTELVCARDLERQLEARAADNMAARTALLALRQAINALEAEATTARLSVRTPAHADLSVRIKPRSTTQPGLASRLPTLQSNDVRDVAPRSTLPAPAATPDTELEHVLALIREATHRRITLSPPQLTSLPAPRLDADDGMHLATAANDRRVSDQIARIELLEAELQDMTVTAAARAAATSPMESPRALAPFDAAVSVETPNLLPPATVSPLSVPTHLTQPSPDGVDETAIEEASVMIVRRVERAQSTTAPALLTNPQGAETRSVRRFFKVLGGRSS